MSDISGGRIENTSNEDDIKTSDNEKRLQMVMNAEKKTVFITGGGSGLGSVLVNEFYSIGYNVFFTFRKNKDSIEKLVRDSNGSIYAYKADASVFSEALESVKKAIKIFGHIDVLVNNAASARDSSLERSTLENFDYTIHNVLYPVYNYIKAVSFFMIQREYGKIINIGSVNGIHGREGSIGYSTAKAGIIGLSKTVAKELGKYSINCNVVAPGFIETEGQIGTSELIKKLVLSECYIKRLSDPVEICNLVLFLASDKAKNITGQVFKIDCGQWI